MEILIKRRALLSALAGAKAARPNEFICLLTGRQENGNVVIEDTLIPPGIQVYRSMSSFSEWMMPYITDQIGTFHSHPSGSPSPSRADARLFSRKGGVNFIAAAPYSVRNVSAFLGTGQKIPFKVIK